MILKKALWRLDSFLRDFNGIFEFSSNEECLIRLSISFNDRDFIMADGTELRKGDPIMELHIWNEHIPPITESGPGLGWGSAVRRRLLQSLGELAAYSERNPRLWGIKAFRGEIALGDQSCLLRLNDAAERWGFQMLTPDHENGLWRCFSDLCIKLHAICLMWAFNPVSLKRKGFWSLKRDQIWISRESLMKRYGKARALRVNRERKLQCGQH